MKIKKLIMLACMGAIFIAQAATDHSIVFVHLGKVLPSYIKHALHQARLFNPEIDIYLVTNSFTNKSSEDQAIIEADNIIAVACETLKKSDNHKDFLKNSTLDGVSKEGFWKKASERFFIIEELMTDYDLHKVTHLESDVMLYACLDKMMPVLARYKTMAAVFDNDDRCIPSFVYIDNSGAIKKLAAFIAKRARQGLNDMQVIALFKNVTGGMRIEYLPLICPEYCGCYELKNALGNTVKAPALYSNNFDEFQSIFDGAAIGQYLGGTDRTFNAQWPGPGFINESCVFNPAHCSFEWIKDECERKVPHLIFKGKKYRINNLHIHSKQLADFRS